MDRIKILCSYLEPCKTFADVGCDHGYCTKYMLDNNLSESAVISDISAKSLEKAKALLKNYIDCGKLSAVCCDGLEKVFGADEVLIAGLGGEEILKILKEGYIPEKFVIQPMKNQKAVRKFLIESGAKITVDDIFSDGKNYYFIIKGEKRGGGKYNERELEYGRDSLKNPLLSDYLNEELGKKTAYLSNEMSDKSRESLERDIEFIKDVLNIENS